MWLTQRLQQCQITMAWIQRKIFLKYLSVSRWGSRTSPSLCPGCYLDTLTACPPSKASLTKSQISADVITANSLGLVGQSFSAAPPPSLNHVLVFVKRTVLRGNCKEAVLLSFLIHKSLIITGSYGLYRDKLGNMERLGGYIRVCPSKI